jgi:RimJ/RimL family protein N-acetyltransferase
MSQPNWREQVPVLHGAYAALREIRPADALTLASYLGDPGVRRYISPPPTSSGAFQGFVRWAQQQRAAGTMICFAVVPHGSEHAVGLFQIRSLTPDFSTAEWGFALAVPFWGTGIFKDAASVAADFAFQTLRVHRLEARAVTSNDRGNGALAKLGAQGEAVLRGGLICDGGRQDQFLWTLIADEWRGHRAAPYCVETTKRRIEGAVMAAERQMFGSISKHRPAESRDCPFLISGIGEPPRPAAIDFDNDTNS